MPSPFFDGMGATIMDLFGECQEAILKPSNGGNVRSVEVIFNAVHQEVDIDGRPVGGPNPRMWIKKGVACPEYGDVIELHGVKYLVREVEPDGLELNELIISKSVEQQCM